VQRPQRIALAARAVLGKRQDGPTPFPERLLGDQNLGLGGHFPVLGRPQAGVEEILLRAAAQLRQAGDFGPAGRPAVQVLERVAAPQRKSAGQRRRRPIRLAVGRQGPSALDQTLETAGVEVVADHRQPVAAGRGLDGVRAQSAA
jgi:hypothetical protein